MCASGPQVKLMGCMAPIEKDAALILAAEWKPFLIGKDGLAGEALWDQMYRSNRQSRDGIFVMAISAADNALWDIRGRYYGVPVYRLLGGPPRESVEMYASCLGYPLEAGGVAQASTDQQEWFSVPEMVHRIWAGLGTGEHGKECGAGTHSAGDSGRRYRAHV
jgi:L-rhamnonate dehydratase